MEDVRRESVTNNMNVCCIDGDEWLVEARKMYGAATFGGSTVKNTYKWEKRPPSEFPIHDCAPFASLLSNCGIGLDCGPLNNWVVCQGRRWHADARFDLIESTEV